jgi:hypothetical protein
MRQCAPERRREVAVRGGLRPCRNEFDGADRPIDGIPNSVQGRHPRFRSGRFFVSKLTGPPRSWVWCLSVSLCKGRPLRETRLLGDSQCCMRCRSDSCDGRIDQRDSLSTPRGGAHRSAATSKLCSPARLACPSRGGIHATCCALPMCAATGSSGRAGGWKGRWSSRGASASQHSVYA